MFSVKDEPLHEFRNNDRWSQVYRTQEGNYLIRMFHKQVWIEDRLIKEHKTYKPIDWQYNNWGTNGEIVQQNYYLMKL